MVEKWNVHMDIIKRQQEQAQGVHTGDEKSVRQSVWIHQMEWGLMVHGAGAFLYFLCSDCL